MKRQALTNKPDCDTITCLTCMPGYTATKSFVKSKTGKVEKRAFNSGKFFCHLEYPVSCITELSKVLKDIEKTPNVMLIRGKPFNTIKADTEVQRTGSGEGDYFQGNFKTPDQGRYWVLIDIDKMALPEGMELSKKNFRKVINWVAKQLPPELQNVSFHWQLSSSAGVQTTKMISIHFWFWLKKPVMNTELKTWAKAFNEQSEQLKIDLALFSHVQPHYTAKPIFVGLEDPFPERSGLVLKKHDAATIVAPLAQRPRQVNCLTTGKPTRTAPSATGFNAFLAWMGDHPGGGGFRDPLLRAAASFVRTHGAANTDPNALYERLRKAVLEADASSHTPADIEKRASYEFIMPMIQSAIKNFGHQGSVYSPHLIEGVAPTVTKAKYLTAAELTTSIQAFIKS